MTLSAGPDRGELLSVTFGTETSMQIGCPESGLKKLNESAEKIGINDVTDIAELTKGLSDE